MGDNIKSVSQYMMANGCVTHEQFVDFLNSLRTDSASQMSEERILEAVATLNKRLAKFNMMVRSTCDDKTFKKYYSLISTVDNEITRQASHHTEKEFEYFRQIWQELQDGPVNIEEIHRIGQGLKINNEKQLIEEWCAKYWLVEEEGAIRLGPRAKAELDVLIQAQDD